MIIKDIEEMNKLIEKTPHIFVKENVSHHEYTSQRMISNMEKFNVPKIYGYNEETKRMVMQKIYGMSVSDMYGEKGKDVPEDIYDQIREIIKYLYNMDIIYPDITGYNFILHEDKIWIIDFEHVAFGKNFKKDHPFVKKFINGHNGWNPKFK